MKERPILFSGPMVRAILDGEQTQTRRVVNPQPIIWSDGVPGGKRLLFMAVGGIDRARWRCPYGQPGDRLWVRETWTPTLLADVPAIEYRADGLLRPVSFEQWKTVEAKTKEQATRLRPSIHMPRWASRLTLEITGIRVERVQEISEEDAKAEGVDWKMWEKGGEPLQARSPFRDLWDSINAKRGFGWDVNPWVWVVSFRKLEETA